MVTWTEDPEAVAYDVVVGDLTALRDSRGDFTIATDACLAAEVADTAVSYADPMNPGDALWILVRGRPGPGYESGGAGQIGTRDPEIAASPFACR